MSKLWLWLGLLGLGHLAVGQNDCRPGYVLSLNGITLCTSAKARLPGYVINYRLR